jgi:hypothetical protein
MTSCRKIWSCEGVVRRRRAGKLRRGSLSEIGGLAKGLTVSTRVCNYFSSPPTSIDSNKLEHTSQESQACVYREEMRAWVQ